MTTEDKVREAFEKYKASKIYPESVAYGYFRAGYMALLNELEPLFATTSVTKTELLYRLPEGVEK